MQATIRSVPNFEINQLVALKIKKDKGFRCVNGSISHKTDRFISVEAGGYKECFAFNLFKTGEIVLLNNKNKITKIDIDKYLDQKIVITAEEMEENRPFEVDKLTLEREVNVDYMTCSQLASKHKLTRNQISHLMQIYGIKANEEHNFVVRKTNNLSESDLDKIRKLHDSGLNSREIAKIYMLGNQTILRFMRKYNFVLKKGRRKK